MISNARDLSDYRKGRPDVSQIVEERQFPSRTPLEGRRIVVTGGSTGLGAAIAEVCTRAGAAVGIVARTRDRLSEVARATGAVPAVADIGDHESARVAMDRLAAELGGGIDTLVNNAGVMLHSRIGAGLSSDWELISRINIVGTLNATHAALPFLQAAEHGDLVVVASTSADRVTAPPFGVYAATKAAQARIAESLRLELADAAPQIRVTLVKPGFMNTPGLGTGTRDPDLQAQVVELKERIGLRPAAVADQICHILELPWEMSIPEITVIPTARQ